MIFGILANSVDPDQTPQNAAFDQVCAICLNFRKLRDKWNENGLKSQFNTIFPAYTQETIDTSVLSVLWFQMGHDIQDSQILSSFFKEMEMLLSVLRSLYLSLFYAMLGKFCNMYVPNACTYMYIAISRKHFAAADILGKFSRRQVHDIVFLFSPGNRLWHFNLHEMSTPIFVRKVRKIFKNVVCWIFDTQLAER